MQKPSPPHPAPKPQPKGWQGNNWLWGLLALALLLLGTAAFFTQGHDRPDPRQRIMADSGSYRLAAIPTRSEQLPAPDTLPTAPTDTSIRLQAQGRTLPVGRLAQRFHLSTEKLQAANGSLPDTLPPQGQIRVPLLAIHPVEAGQKLPQLARAYRVPEALIRRANPGISDPLAPGRKVLIPYP